MEFSIFLCDLVWAVKATLALKIEMHRDAIATNKEELQSRSPHLESYKQSITAGEVSLDRQHDIFFIVFYSFFQFL